MSPALPCPALNSKTFQTTPHQSTQQHLPLSIPTHQHSFSLFCCVHIACICLRTPTHLTPHHTTPSHTKLYHSIPLHRPTPPHRTHPAHPTMPSTPHNPTLGCLPILSIPPLPTYMTTPHPTTPYPSIPNTTEWHRPYSFNLFCCVRMTALPTLRHTTTLQPIRSHQTLPTQSYCKYSTIGSIPFPTLPYPTLYDPIRLQSYSNRYPE